MIIDSLTVRMTLCCKCESNLEDMHFTTYTHQEQAVNRGRFRNYREGFPYHMYWSKD